MRHASYRQESAASVIIRPEEQAEVIAAVQQGGESPRVVPNDEEQLAEQPMEAPVQLVLPCSKDDDNSYKKKKFIMMGVIVALILGAGVGIGAGVGLSSSPGKSSSAEDPTEGAPSGCDLDALLYQPCQQHQEGDDESIIILESLPSQLSQDPLCKDVLDRYTSVYVPKIKDQVDPRFSQDIGSCDPSNLAVWSIANREEPSEKEPEESLADLYVWRTFFFATRPGDSRVDDSWLSSSTSSPCDWHGLTCDSSSMVVKKAIFSNIGMEGTLPSELGLATALGTSCDFLERINRFCRRVSCTLTGIFLSLSSTLVCVFAKSAGVSKMNLLCLAVYHPSLVCCLD